MPNINFPFSGMAYEEEEEENPYSYLENLADMGEPEVDMQTPVQDKFMQFIQGVPKRADYHPKFKNRILPALVAGLGGAAEGMKYGVGLGQEMLDRPYNRAMEEFQTTAATYKPALAAERGGIESKRKIIKDMIDKQKSTRNFLLNMEKAATAHEDKLKSIEAMKDKEEAKRLLAEEKMKWSQYTFGEVQKIRQANLGLKQQGLNLAKAREGRLAGGVDKPLPAAEQKSIAELAASEVSKDPRFEKFYSPEDKAFGDEITEGKETYTIDPETKKALSAALAKAKSDIARRTRKSYENMPQPNYPGGGSISSGLEPWYSGIFDDEEEE
jgi:hypothetical protein